MYFISKCLTQTFFVVSVDFIFTNYNKTLNEMNEFLQKHTDAKCCVWDHVGKNKTYQLMSTFKSRQV